MMFFIIEVRMSVQTHTHTHTHTHTQGFKARFRSDTYLRLLQSLFLSSPSHTQKKAANDVLRDAEDRLDSHFSFLLSVCHYISRYTLNIMYVINDGNKRAAFPVQMFTKYTNTLQ
jgi:hypothetical protein